MKNIKFAAVAAAALTFVAAPAFAQTFSPTTFYGNLGYSHVDGDGVDLGAISARLGARLGQYVGVEAEGGLGVNDDTVGGAKVDLKHSVAGYVVGFAPLTPKIDLIGRVGYGTTRLGAEAGGVTVKDNQDSWNYGVGGQYFFDAANGLRAEWTRFDFTNDAGKADVWSVHYVRKF